ncbi:hypothetical protein ACGFZR_24845 [Streptomyces sp. NPDC048241]|uniref:hypothetical protein n=1 Tax=Streptomyces sp. NPDC048241 TaxID=3365521 RepID=UPI003716C348
MPRPTDQLPTDPTDLARRVRDLENALRELRGARRMTSATVGRLRVYSPDGQTLLAELGPAPEGGGGLQTWGLQAGDDTPVSATLSSGELRFQPTDGGFTGVPANVAYSGFLNLGSDLVLSSGAAQPPDWRSVVDLGSVTDGGVPTVVVSGFREIDGVGESGPANLMVQGSLTCSNIVAGTVAITPSAANTPTSVTVSGLSVPGAFLRAFTGIANPAPGSTGSTNGVTGTGYSNLTSSGMTVWATRQNTTAVTVSWLIMGFDAP